VSSLAEMVELLIRESRQLKRALARAEKARRRGNLGQAAKALSGLQRRLTRALDSSPTATTLHPRATTTAAASIRTRRKVTDPDVLERRRQALAKARAVRQARRPGQRIATMPGLARTSLVGWRHCDHVGGRVVGQTRRMRPGSRIVCEDRLGGLIHKWGANGRGRNRDFS